jgi:26S proteasome regulatory subunit N2
MDDSLTFALGAGKQFDLSDSSEYVGTIICMCCKMKRKEREK